MPRTLPRTFPRPRSQRFPPRRLELLSDQPRDPHQPITRGDCEHGPRPCPWVRCKFHLYVDTLEIHPERGRHPGLKFNFPDVALDALPQTCALDVADDGGSTLSEIATVMNLTREAVRQIEAIALGKLPEQFVLRAREELTP